MLERSIHSKKTLQIAFIFFIIGLLLAGIIWRQYSAAGVQTYQQSRLLLDTVVDLRVVASDKSQAEAALEDAFAEMQRVEHLFSKYREASQIFLINQHAGQQPVSVTDEIGELLRRALGYSERTDGLFDVRIGPLVELWGIGTERETVPGFEELEQVLAGLTSTELEIRTANDVFLSHPQGSLDLGGIAKGYSIDRAIEVLKQHGITSALLNAGGDIRCIGGKSDGSAWRIGVKHPRDKGILAIVELKNMAVATSGDYERFFLRQGIRYHHLLDPRNGLPARNCQSVTILAPSAELADVMATAVFIMGPERGLEFLEAHVELEGMIVGADGEIVKSSGFSFQPKQS